MKKCCTLLFLVFSTLLLSACNSKAIPIDTAPPRQPERLETASLTETEEPLVVYDYADFYLNRENYDGKMVTIAGEINGLSASNDLIFHDRLGMFDKLSILWKGMEVSLTEQNLRGKSSGYYRVGEYVLVQGTFHAKSFSLYEAVVLSKGEEAKAYCDLYMEKWKEKGQSYADTIPITDYMDITENYEYWEGKRVRVVGQIQNVWSWGFDFRSRVTDYTNFNISLYGCPKEMRSLCVENQYVVVSGIVTYGHDAALKDCYVECVGDDIKTLSDQVDSEWIQKYLDARNEYISICTEYTFDELARYPKKYYGSDIQISGTVLRKETIAGDNVFILDVGQDRIIKIIYDGKQYRDPEILEGDTVAFYGRYSGTTTYEDVLGERHDIPHMYAQYSSINYQEQK